MLDPAELQNLSTAVVNELSDLEDRLHRAEIALERERRLNVELHDEVTALRAVVGEVQALTGELREAASSIDGRLERLLVAG